MKKHYYIVYGLTICSEIQLSELVKIDEDDIINNKIDVNIKYDDVPEYVSKDISRKRMCSYSFNESWFYIHNTAIYRICNGKEIYVKYKGGEIEEIKNFLLGGAFICLLFQRKTIAIHGGGIVVNDEGIIVTGMCGAGKSTLTSAFRKKGYRYLSDDLSVVGITEFDKIEIKPAYPQQKLCRDAAIKLGYNINELVKIDKERDKFAIPATEDFINCPKKVKAIFEIIPNDNVKDIKIEEIKGIKKFNSIINNLYERDIAKCYGIDSFISVILNISRNISYYKLMRPKEMFTVDEQIELITAIV